jgi:hypothetical protein
MRYTSYLNLYVLLRNLCFIPSVCMCVCVCACVIKPAGTDNTRNIYYLLGINDKIASTVLPSSVRNVTNILLFLLHARMPLETIRYALNNHDI